MSALAFDEMYRITRYLSHRDVMALSMSSKAYRWLCDDDRFWCEKARDAYRVDLASMFPEVDKANMKYGMLEVAMEGELPKYSFYLTDLGLDADDSYLWSSVLMHRHGVHDAEHVLGIMRMSMASGTTRRVDWYWAYSAVVDTYMRERDVISIYMMNGCDFTPFDMMYPLRYGVKGWHKQDPDPVPFDLEKMAQDMYEDEDIELDSDFAIEFLMRKMLHAKRYNDILVLVDRFMHYNELTMGSVVRAVDHLDQVDDAILDFLKRIIGYRLDPKRGITHDTDGVIDTLVELPRDLVDKIVASGCLTGDEMKRLYVS